MKPKPTINDRYRGHPHQLHIDPPTDGDTLSVGGVTYTFCDAAELPNEIQIGSLEETISNFHKATGITLRLPDVHDAGAAVDPKPVADTETPISVPDSKIMESVQRMRIHELIPGCANQALFHMARAFNSLYEAHMTLVAELETMKEDQERRVTSCENLINRGQVAQGNDRVRVSTKKEVWRWAATETDRLIRGAVLDEATMTEIRHLRDV